MRSTRTGYQDDCDRREIAIMKYSYQLMEAGESVRQIHALAVDIWKTVRKVTYTF